MSFDRVAPFYATLEWIAFGTALQRARTAYLPRLKNVRRALVAGEGNGKFLIELARFNPGIEIDCVDSSVEMLRLAQRLLIRSGGDEVRFHHTDILKWRSAFSDYDLIATHFFLDCFNPSQLQSVVDRIASMSAPHATWLFSDFSVPKKGVGRLHARIWLNAMYRFFRYAASLQTKELVDPSAVLRGANFKLRERCDSRFGLITAQLWQR